MRIVFSKLRPGDLVVEPATDVAFLVIANDRQALSWLPLYGYSEESHNVKYGALTVHSHALLSSFPLSWDAYALASPRSTWYSDEPNGGELQW